MKKPLVALVGNPNTGKTTLFNDLCLTRQKVGNFPGVTVERKSGFIKTAQAEIEILDLPGLYSLNPLSPDEMVACQSLQGELENGTKPDAIVMVVDATNLERNLYLFRQVAELEQPLLVALTMADELEKKGVELDLEVLQEELGVPVIPMVKGKQALIEAIEQLLKDPKKSEPKWIYPEDWRKAFRQNQPGNMFSNLESLVGEGKNIGRGELATSRYKWARKVCKAVEHRTEPRSKWAKRLDHLLLHRFWGLIIFVGIMFLVFQSIYSWAGPLMDGIEAATIWLGDSLGQHLANQPMLQSLVVDGVIAGVGSVIIFLPQIVILFLFIALLEDSGYLARAAFLMDRLLGWTGLNGRAFIPMMSSFACAIPGVMAARVMTDPKARLATILIAPLMSCSARLPVYVLLIGAFIEPHYGPTWAGITLFGMHLIGLAVALPLATILNRAILKTPSMPFIMEIPPFRTPKWVNVLFRTYEAGKKFTLKAGTIIFCMSIMIWALSYFPRPLAVEEQTIQQANQSGITDESQIEQMVAGAYLEQSYLGRTGKAVQPIFSPLGFDWKITVGILGAFPAREVILSTLGIIYQIGEADEESQSLKLRMAQETWPDGSKVFTPLVAIVLMIFFALCSQCMSTLAIIQKELQSWKWAGFVFTYMTGLAYLIGLIVYQVGIGLS